MTTSARYTLGRHFLYRDGRVVVPVGAHVVPPSGPDWPWRVDAEAFDHAFAQLAELGLTSARIDLLWAAVEPEAGRLDEDHLAVLDAVLDAADRHRIALHPTLFVGGEVGDAYWDLPWASGRNPHADADLLTAQVAHAQALARRWHDRPGLIAWDLTDEPPFWVHAGDTTDAHARTWTRTLAEALHREDPGRLVTVGTASQEVDHGPFRADVIADQVDFCCVHPYPIYSPELYPDALVSPRMTHAAAFETALARGAGRPVMVHEYGASSTQFAPEAIAAYDRLLCWSSFGRGSVGFYAWCWVDAEPDAYARAPYVRMPHETQFGVLTHDGRPRPRAAVLAGLSTALAGLDLAALAGDGPRTDVAIPVPYEYARPYDPASYGLDGAPAGPYLPAERAWNPDRDVKPLVRAWLNAFVLSARAGLAARFPRERLDDAWPDAPLVLLPAPLTSTSSSLLHLRTSSWAGAADHLRGGRSIYLSCSSETAIPQLHEWAGVRVADRAPVRPQVAFTIVAPFGDLRPGDRLTVPAGSADPHLRGVLLAPDGAEVIAVDDDDHPVLTRLRVGSGQVVVCAHPVELILAAVPDAHEPQDPWWRLYRGVAAEAGVRALAEARHPDLTNGVLTGPGGGLLVITNHSPRTVRAPLVLPPDADDPQECLGAARLSHEPDLLLDVPGHEAALITWRRKR